MYKYRNETVLADIADEMEVLAVEVSLLDASYEKQLKTLRKIQSDFKKFLSMNGIDAGN